MKLKDLKEAHDLAGIHKDAIKTIHVNTDGIIEYRVGLTKMGLSSLKGFPVAKAATTDIDVSQNRLTGLRYLPSYIRGELNASFNEIQDISELPACRRVDLSHNRISEINGSLELVEYLDLSYNDFTSMESFSRCQDVKFMDLKLAFNNITSLKGIHTQLGHCEILDLTGNQIEDSILGLLLIPGIKAVTYDPYGPRGNFLQLSVPFDMINKFIKEKKTTKADVIELQNVLLDKGYAELAEL